MNISAKKIYTINCVSEAFKDNALNGLQNIQTRFSAAKNALSKLDNIIFLKDNSSAIPDEFEKTKQKFSNSALDAYGFVSRADKAIVLVEDNHNRKDERLEGNKSSQAEDTITHEIGHLIDDELSTSNEFVDAYINDLKNIELMLNSGVEEIKGEKLKDMLVYLKHYIEGVNFEDGIDKKDITREGLRENFAECFSTIADSHPTKINDIYSELFPNTMAVTKEFVA